MHDARNPKGASARPPSGLAVPATLPGTPSQRRGGTTSRAPAGGTAVKTFVARGVTDHDAAAVGAGRGVLVGAEGDEGAGWVGAGGPDRGRAARLSGGRGDGAGDEADRH